MKNHSFNIKLIQKKPEEDLKKKLTFINLKTEYFAFLDETSCQNVLNIIRVLYALGERNTQTKHPIKFGIYVTG